MCVITKVAMGPSGSLQSLLLPAKQADKPLTLNLGFCCWCLFGLWYLFFWDFILDFGV
jgi:hypothetical protein